jgi:hypothetical protein
MLLRSKIMSSLRVISAHSLVAQNDDLRHTALIGRSSYSFISGFLVNGGRWPLGHGQKTFVAIGSGLLCQRS